MALHTARNLTNWQRLEAAVQALDEVMADCDLAEDCNVPVEERRQIIASMREAEALYRSKLFPNGKPAE